MQVCQPVEAPVTGRDAFLPEAVPLVRGEYVTFSETSDIVGCQHRIDGSLVYFIHWQKKIFQHTMHPQTVGFKGWVGGAGNAALTHTVGVETISDSSYALGT